MPACKANVYHFGGNVVSGEVGIRMKSQSVSMLHDALDHLRLALDLLDGAAAPPQIGAHVDLAIHQLGSIVTEAPKVQPIPIEQGAARH